MAVGTKALLILDTARDLARRESGCCSFFAFEIESVGDGLVMRIGIPQTRIEVLDALESHARA